MTSRNSVLINNKQEPVLWCIIKKGAVQEPFASHRARVSVRKLMKSDLVSPSAVWTIEFDSIYRVFSLEVIAAMLVLLNKGKAAMLVSPNNHPGIKLYSYTNAFFCFS